eukprot:TRINITY_DN79994_c0_g1_i1.p1 TRINITY_DN79994_c0_g1~~TRINITY_DN79994_c0_g1_i1.p1  ORF type:complete len:776 (+),score=171.55 TRINITY_DN79994_c0_g1_i1:317-2644(+)
MKYIALILLATSFVSSTGYKVRGAAGLVEDEGKLSSFGVRAEPSKDDEKHVAAAASKAEKVDDADKKKADGDGEKAKKQKPKVVKGLEEALVYLKEHPDEFDDILGQKEAADFVAKVHKAEQERKAEAVAKAKKNPPGGIAGALGIDVNNMSSSQLEPLMYFCAVLAVGLAVSFEFLHKRWADADLDRPIQLSEEKQEEALPQIFKGVAPLVRPYFSGPEKTTGFSYLTIMFTLGLWDLGLGLIIMVWHKDFWDSIQKKQTEKFMNLMFQVMALATAKIIVTTYNQYISQMLTIAWRKYMTKWLLGEWMEDKIFYRLQLDVSKGVPDNPDQRIQEDIRSFIDMTLMLGFGFLQSVGSLVSRLPMLLILSPTYAFGLYYCPGWLFFVALAFSGFGAVVAHTVGHHLIVVNFNLQKYEANFRYGIVQIRDNAESIALYGSERCEKERLHGAFEWVVLVWWKAMIYRKRLGFFQSFYYQTSAIFPYLILAPSYFSGEISLGTMFMLFDALHNVKGGFDWFLNSYSTLTDYRATVDRLSNFTEAVEEKKIEFFENNLHMTKVQPENVKAVAWANDLTVSLPGTKGEQKTLWSNASFEVNKGEFVLLTAPEGTGKSCFFRAMAGIWPHASGEIYLPEGTLFVPQKSYVPQGSLKQAVCYPDCEDDFNDEAVSKALKAVKLTAVEGRDLSEQKNWALLLSGGETQKLAVARIILRKPPVVFLDEATSAMGNDTATEVFQLLKTPGVLPDGAAVITVSHDIDLMKPLHDKHFSYDATKWKLE